MQSDSPAIARDMAATQVGSKELAEGLMLLRASTLKLIRLQLAMERNDRDVALEAVDELVALDRKLEHYIADVRPGGEQLLFRSELEAERAALNREKLTLAAEVIRRKEPPAPVEIEAPDPISWDEFEFVGETSEPRHRTIKWLAFLFVILAAAAAVYVYAGPVAVTWITAQLRALS